MAMKQRLNAQEVSEFRQYLRQCTDNQVRGVFEHESKNNHPQEIELARDEAARRGIDL